MELLLVINSRLTEEKEKNKHVQSPIPFDTLTDGSGAPEGSLIGADLAESSAFWEIESIEDDFLWFERGNWGWIVWMLGSTGGAFSSVKD